MTCYLIRLDNGDTAFMCGTDLGPQCECLRFADNLCDYPIAKGKTCDRNLCEDHTHEIAPNLHYCADHYKLWREFVDSGGVKETLENVVAYKEEKKKDSP